MASDNVAATQSASTPIIEDPLPPLAGSSLAEQQKSWDALPATQRFAETVCDLAHEEDPEETWEYFSAQSYLEEAIGAKLPDETATKILDLCIVSVRIEASGEANSAMAPDPLKMLLEKYRQIVARLEEAVRSENGTIEDDVAART